MSNRTIALLAALLFLGFVGLAGVSRADEPVRFAPGDEIEIAVLSAPDLSRTLRVGPDGRIALPLAGSVRAQDLTGEELARVIAEAYGQILREPLLDVRPNAYAPRQVYVGGEVARPGVYEIPAGADPLQAILLAGGFTNGADRDQTLLLRRSAQGLESAVLDLDPRRVAQAGARLPGVRHHDVVWAPKKPIAQVGLFVQQYVREAIPVSFQLGYDLAQLNR